MAGRKRVWLSFLLGAISIILMLYLLLSVDLGAVLALLGSANPLLLPAGIALILAELGVKIVRWRLFLDAYRLRIKPADVASSFLAGSFLANLTPGRIGEAARPYFLKRRYKGISFFKLLPAIVVERFIDVVVLFAFSAALLFFASPAVFLAVLVLLAAMLFVLMSKSLAYKCAVLLFKRKSKIKKMLDNFYAGVGKLRLHTARYFAILLLTVIAWLLDATILYLAVLALVPAGPAAFVQCLGILSFATLAGIVSSLPGGIGSFEAVMFAFFAALGLPGPLALSITLAYRFISFWIGALIGGVFFVKEVKS